MHNQPDARGRTHGETVLTYAMAVGIAAAALSTTGLLALGAPAFGTIIGMTIIGALWVFTITPHLVATWLNCSVDSLLGISHTQRLPQTTRTTNTPDTEIRISGPDPTDR